MSIEPWVWAIVGICIALLLALGGGILYYVRLKKAICSDEEKRDDKTTATIDSVANLDETTIKHDNVVIKPSESSLYGQQFAVVTPAQTKLTPAPQHSNKRKNTADVVNHPISPIREENKILIQEELNHARGAFSLTPVYYIQQQQQQQQVGAATPLSQRSISSSNYSIHRTLSPLENLALSAKVWRGPTPPCSHYQNFRKTPSVNSNAAQQ